MVYRFLVALEEGNWWCEWRESNRHEPMSTRAAGLEPDPLPRSGLSGFHSFSPSVTDFCAGGLPALHQPERHVLRLVFAAVASVIAPILPGIIHGASVASLTVRPRARSHARVPASIRARSRSCAGVGCPSSSELPTAGSSIHPFTVATSSAVAPASSASSCSLRARARQPLGHRESSIAAGLDRETLKWASMTTSPSELKLKQWRHFRSRGPSHSLRGQFRLT